VDVIPGGQISLSADRGGGLSVFPFALAAAVQMLTGWSGKSVETPPSDRGRGAAFICIPPA